jgi:hypothetical protein
MDASFKWIKPGMRYGGNNGVNLSDEWVAEGLEKAVDMILVVSHPTEGPSFLPGTPSRSCQNCPSSLCAH